MRAGEGPRHLIYCGIRILKGPVPAECRRRPFLLSGGVLFGIDMRILIRYNIINIVSYAKGMVRKNDGEFF